MEEIETNISGIPALVKVIHFNQVQGSYSHNAPSDYDYYGYTEMDYEICDRRGRPAPWLERKLTDQTRMQLEAQITGILCAHQ